MANIYLQRTITRTVFSGMEETQEAIRNGKIRPGDQAILTMDGKDTIWDVIGRDCEELVNPKLAHSITIQLHGLLEARYFDTKTEWGANKWETSEIKAYLNSEEFKNRFADIVPYLAKVRKKNSNGQQTEDMFFLLSKEEYTPGQTPYPYYEDIRKQQTEDLFFLLSEAEYTPGQTPYSYYEDIRNRVKFNDIGGPERHWTRSAYQNAVSLVRAVCASGVISTGHARYEENPYSPACVIGA